MHGLHIVAGLVVLLVSIVRSTDQFMAQDKKTRMYEMTSTFWHFLDLLWVYLFIFLLYTQK